MKFQILILLVLGMLFSCTSNQKTKISTDTIIGTTIVDDTKTADTLIKIVDVKKTPKLFKGLYTFGDEVSTFRECENNSTVYWVNDSLSSLYKNYQKTTEFLSYPYESVYVEVEGYLAGKSNLGYASEYENVLVVTNIKKIEPKNYKTLCYNYEFIAVGNEPFWSVDIIPAERRIILKHVGLEKVFEFPYVTAKVNGGTYSYETKNQKGDKLSVVIKKEKCSDGMSDRVYSYSSNITINNEVLKGCAIKKGEIIK